MENKLTTKQKIQRTTLGGGFAAALFMAIPFIVEREGESLSAYRDSVGVWTICNGETENVTPGERRTKEECNRLTQSRVGQFMSQVDAALTVAVPPATLAAHTSFAYNIGIAGYRRSSTLRLTNQGQPIAGCEAMMKWYQAGGRDCRIKSNNCHGVIKRRLDEIDLCKKGYTYE